MLYTLKNDKLEITIRSLGAEIQSIIHSGINYSWSADPKFWGKKAPLLFPIVGRVTNSQTKIDGKLYEIEQHGFIKYTEFEALEISSEKIVLEGRYTEQNLAVYPYKFKIIVEYYIKDDKFYQNYTVCNLENKKIIYGFGLHPAYNLESIGCDFEDCYIDFNQDIKINKPTLLENRMFDFVNRTKVEITDGKLPLKHDLFTQDAIILDDLSFDKVTLYAKNKRLFDFEFKGFSLFAIWQPLNAPFLCLEPWNSVGGVNSMNENLESNETMKYLEANQSETFSIILTF